MISIRPIATRTTIQPSTPSEPILRSNTTVPAPDTGSDPADTVSLAPKIGCRAADSLGAGPAALDTLPYQRPGKPVEPAPSPLPETQQEATPTSLMERVLANLPAGQEGLDTARFWLKRVAEERPDSPDGGLAKLALHLGTLGVRPGSLDRVYRLALAGCTGERPRPEKVAHQMAVGAESPLDRHLIADACLEHLRAHVPSVRLKLDMVELATYFKLLGETPALQTLGAVQLDPRDLAVHLLSQTPVPDDRAELARNLATLLKTDGPTEQRPLYGLWDELLKCGPGREHEDALQASILSDGPTDGAGLAQRVLPFVNGLDSADRARVARAANDFLSSMIPSNQARTLKRLSTVAGLPEMGLALVAQGQAMKTALPLAAGQVLDSELPGNRVARYEALLPELKQSAADAWTAQAFETLLALALEVPDPVVGEVIVAEGLKAMAVAGDRHPSLAVVESTSPFWWSDAGQGPPRLALTRTLERLGKVLPEVGTLASQATLEANLEGPNFARQRFFAGLRGLLPEPAQPSVGADTATASAPDSHDLTRTSLPSLPDAAPAKQQALSFLQSLSNRGTVEQRVQEARTAIDELVQARPEAAAAELARSLTSASVRPLTQERLLRQGLEICAAGAGGAGPPLASAALKLAGLAWDDQEKASLLSAGFRRLQQTDGHARSHPFSRAVAMVDDSELHQAALELLADGPQVLVGPRLRPGEALADAARLMQSLPPWANDARADLGWAVLAQSVGPEIAALTGKVLGNWSFTRLDVVSQAAALSSLLAPGPLNLPTAIGRLAKSILEMPPYDRSSALRRLIAQARARAPGPDQGLVELSATALNNLPPYCKSRGLDGKGAAVVSGFLGALGGHEDLSGRKLAGVLSQSLKGGFHGPETLESLLKQVQAIEPVTQWKIAYQMAGRLCDFCTYYEQTSSLLSALRALEDLPAGEDPVTAVAGAFAPSPVARLKQILLGSPDANVDSPWLPPGLLRSEQERIGVTLELLGTHAESPAMRALATQAHRAVAEGH